MSDREPRQCDFCLTTVADYSIAQDGSLVTCMKCPGWNAYVRASQDADYRRQMTRLLVGLPEPQPWGGEPNSN